MTLFATAITCRQVLKTAQTTWELSAMQNNEKVWMCKYIYIFCYCKEKTLWEKYFSQSRFVKFLRFFPDIIFSCFLLKRTKNCLSLGPEKHTMGKKVKKLPKDHSWPKHDSCNWSPPPPWDSCIFESLGHSWSFAWVFFPLCFSHKLKINNYIYTYMYLRCDSHWVSFLCSPSMMSSLSASVVLSSASTRSSATTSFYFYIIK